MINRNLAVVALAAALVTSALADLSYNVETSTVTFNDGTVSTLNFHSGGVNNGMLDFTAGSLPLFVQGNTDRSSAVIDIVYTATSSDELIAGLNSLVSNWELNQGTLEYSYDVTSLDGSVSFLSFSNLLTSGGGPNVQIDEFDFASATDAYRVTARFELSANGGTESFASVGFIEQNAQPVPEPASMAALGLGALAMLRRRRKAA